MADGSVIIDTALNDEGLNKGIDKIDNNFSKLKNTAIKAISAIGFSTLVKDGIEYNSTIEQLQTSFEVMTGSADKAIEIIEKLKDVGAKTPYELSGLAQTTQTLMQYGMSADEAYEATINLGDIAQGSAEKMQSIALAYGQMSSAGKVNMQDIKQMINAGFNPLQAIMEMTGETMAQVTARYEEGKISVDEVTQAMAYASSENGKYYQSMEKQSQTLSGQWSTLKDNLNELLGTAVTPLSNFLKDTLLPVINDILAGGEEMKKWIDENSVLLTILGGIVGTLTAAMIAYTVAKNADLIITGLYVGATTLATTVTTAFGAVLAFITSPVTLVVLAIGALITVIVLLVKNWDTVKEKTLEVWNKIKSVISEKIEQIKSFVTQKIPQIVNNIIDWFKKLPSNLMSIGKNLVQGIWEGISGSISWLKNKISGWVGNVTSFIKNLFGIHSPSTLFRDEIGENLGLGIGEGFDESLSSVYKDMQKAVELENAKLTSNLTSNHQIQVSSEDNRQSRLESIDNNKEIVVNSKLEVSDKVLATAVNRVNARQQLQYGIA